MSLFIYFEFHRECALLQGMLAVGLFMHEDTSGNGLNNGKVGLFRGGGWSSLGEQALAVACIIGWIGACTLIVILVSE